MKARLLIVNPEMDSTPPVAPMFLFEKDGQIYLYTTEWAFPVTSGALEEVNIEEVQQRLQLRSDECAYLTDVRELPPGEWMSPEVLDWLRHWWAEAASEFAAHPPLALAT